MAFAVGLKLTDVAPKDKPWKKHKAENLPISQYYLDDPRFVRLGARMADCADWLVFGEIDPKADPAGRKIKLTKAHFCRVRLCPVCAWRKSLALIARFMRNLPAYIPVLSKLAFLHVTLTLRNPPMEDLRDTIKAANSALNCLFKRDPWVRLVKGCVKGWEITKGQDGNPHPHLHIIIAVPIWYFSGRYYIKQVDWARAWRDVLGLDYIPLVHVQKVKANKRKANELMAKSGVEMSPALAGLIAGVVEAVKYDTKPADIVDDQEFLYGLTEQIKGLRFLEARGCFKGIFKDHETGEGGDQVSEDEMLLKSDDPSGEVLTDWRLFFGWHNNNYFLKRRFLDARRE